MTTVFSLGHSTLEWPTFQRLLDRAEIGVVIDLISNSVSRLPHFNRAELKERLHVAGVGYVFLGLELGGRPRNGGGPDYQRMAAAPLFAERIARVEEMAARTRPALMCSEHEPLTCHRCRSWVAASWSAATTSRTFSATARSSRTRRPKTGCSPARAKPTLNSPPRELSESQSPIATKP